MNRLKFGNHGIPEGGRIARTGRSLDHIGILHQAGARAGEAVTTVEFCPPVSDAVKG